MGLGIGLLGKCNAPWAEDITGRDGHWEHGLNFGQVPLSCAQKQQYFVLALVSCLWSLRIFECNMIGWVE